MSTSSCTTTQDRPARGRSSATAGQRLIIVGPDARSPSLGRRAGLASGHRTAGRPRRRRDRGPRDPVDPRDAPRRLRGRRVHRDSDGGRCRSRSRATRGSACGGSLARSAPHGTSLIEALTDWTGANLEVLARAAAPRRQEVADIDVDRELLWDSPEDGDGEFYAWIAGEAATVKTLRRLLVSAARGRPQARRLHGLLAARSGRANRMNSAARTRRARVVLACVIVLLAGAVVLSLGVGARAIAPSSVLQALFAPMAGNNDHTVVLTQRGTRARSSGSSPAQRSPSPAR